MLLKSSFNFINEFFFIFKKQIRKIYLKSSIYNKKISRVEDNILVYQPSLNILSSLIKYEKQKKKIEDFNVKTIWENKDLNYKNFNNLHSFYWLFSIDLKSTFSCVVPFIFSLGISKLTVCTFAPSSTSILQRGLPIIPVPPVTSMFFDS